MKILTLMPSLALIATLVPVTPENGHTDMTGQSLKLAGIAGTGAPLKPRLCETDDLSTADCHPDVDEEIIPSSTDRGGHA